MLHDFIKLTSHQNNKNSLDCANIRRNQTHSIFRQNEVCPVPLQIRTRPWPLIRKCHDYRCPNISCVELGRFPTNVTKQTCLKEEALWKLLLSNNKKNVISLRWIAGHYYISYLALLCKKVANILEKWKKSLVSFPLYSTFITSLL